MKKIICMLIAAVILTGAFLINTFASDAVVYISINNGSNENSGLSPNAPKKTLGSVSDTGAISVLKNGGTMIITEKVQLGGNYTLSANGPITVKATYDGKDYIDTNPKTNPAGGSLKMIGGVTLTVASDLILDDIILFQESKQNTILVKSGATLTATDRIICMSRQDYYMNIKVEAGGTAIINGGIFSDISGEGTIQIANDVKILGNAEVENNNHPAVAANVAYLSTNGGNNDNSGLQPDAPKKTLGKINDMGAVGLLKDGGTLVICGRYQCGNYTLELPAPITITANYGGVDFKKPTPAKNPESGSFKFTTGAALTVASDLIFDDIILFQEANQNTIIVKSGATLTVTDSCVLMSAKEYHYKIVIEEGGKAILSEAAQNIFEIENSGTLNTYVAKASEKTVVRLTIGKTEAFVNDSPRQLDTAPIIRCNRTMLPVRFVAEAFGATVSWDGATSTATVKADDAEISVTIGANYATVNGKTVELDSPAFIENNRTYLPVRAVAEALHATVEWDGVTSTATLTK